MLLTEDQIASAAGLPGPVVAELFAPLFPAPAAAVYLDEDAVKAQIAVMMLQAGIRWRWVQTAVAGLPDDPAELARLRGFWAQRTLPMTTATALAAPAGGVPVAVWVVCALIVGIVIGVGVGVRV